jgi:hypothetical protein
VSWRKKYHNPARTRTGYYRRVDENPYIAFRPLDPRSKYVGYFVGFLVNYPVRSELANLSSEHFQIENTSKSSNASHALFKKVSGTDEQERQQYWSHYADAMAERAFSQCPRGLRPKTSGYSNRCAWGIALSSCRMSGYIPCASNGQRTVYPLLKSMSANWLKVWTRIYAEPRGGPACTAGMGAVLRRKRQVSLVR